MAEQKYIMPARSGGFTMIELITVMIIAGILAATAMPKFFSNSVFDSRGFHDSAMATLRYAQKTAIAQRRFVCVAFGANPASVTLTYDTTAPSAAHLAANCSSGNSPLPDASGQLPKTSSPCSISNPCTVYSSNVSFTSPPTNFSFDALGNMSSSTSLGVQISGASLITVEAGTGYVH
jgi:MSHA pilin protein MshC